MNTQSTACFDHLSTSHFLLPQHSQQIVIVKREWEEREVSSQADVSLYEVFIKIIDSWKRMVDEDWDRATRWWVGRDQAAASLGPSLYDAAPADPASAAAVSFPLRRRATRYNHL